MATSVKTDSLNQRHCLCASLKSLTPSTIQAAGCGRLEETFPSHVVCRWMGNSVMVAQKHYLQTTEAHYEKAVQNPVQQASELLRNAPHSAPTGLSEAPENADSQRLKGNKINPTRARTVCLYPSAKCNSENWWHSMWHSSIPIELRFRVSSLMPMDSLIRIIGDTKLG